MFSCPILIGRGLDLISRITYLVQFSENKFSNLVIMFLRVTPVPIPNTKVKPKKADGTAWVTVWESRLLPGHMVH